jgi:methionyl-tRNA formyltransferase
MMRIIFMGSPDFALPCLDEILKLPHELVAVVTQPDRPKGRGKKLTGTPVKERALVNNIPVYQPEKVNNRAFIKQVKDLMPDLIIVVAFGQILKPELLSIPHLGCVNVHASLLPKYRGAAPVHWAIINGEKETGVTTMLMDSGMDTGDMIIKRTVEITSHDNVESLHDKLAILGADALRETIELIAANKAPRIKQNHECATYAPLLKKEDEIINWNKSVWEVYNHIRGMNPWPGTYTSLNGNRIKIWKSSVNEEHSTGISGIVLDVINGKGFIVQCQKGSILIEGVQPQGGRRIPADDFARGYRLEKGRRLGSAR